MRNALKRVRQNRFLQILLARFTAADVSNNAIIIAYYALLSIFPLVLVVGNALPFLHIDSHSVLEYLSAVIPANIGKTIMPIIKSFISGGSGGVLSISALVALWSASQLIAAIRKCLNQAYQVSEDQNFLINRVLSFLLMLILTVLLALILVVFTFGQIILETLNKWLNLPIDWLNTLTHLKWPVAIIGMFIVMLLMYYAIPSARVKWRYIWIGAIVATFGGLGLSQVFALYIRYFASKVTTYGTIGTFIILMFWLNFSGFILMFGGVVNAAVQEYSDGKIESKRKVAHRIIQWFR